MVGYQHFSVDNLVSPMEKAHWEVAGVIDPRWSDEVPSEKTAEPRKGMLMNGSRSFRTEIRTEKKDFFGFGRQLR